MTKHTQTEKKQWIHISEIPTFMMSLVPDLAVFEVSEV